MKTNQRDSTGNSAFTTLAQISGHRFYHLILISSNFRYKFSVLALTYVAYTCYHMTRKPISVVKTVLHRNCSLVDSSELIRSATDPSSEETWCDYAPFGKFDKAKMRTNNSNISLVLSENKQTRKRNQKYVIISLVQSSSTAAMSFKMKRKM